MTSSSELGNASPLSLQFLLFIDDRPSSQDSVQEISYSLARLLEDYHHDLQVLEISKHPHSSRTFSPGSYPFPD